MSFDLGQLRWLSPEIALFAFGMLVLLHDVVVKRPSRAVSLSVTLLGLGVAGVLDLLNLQYLSAARELAQLPPHGVLLAFSNMLAVDEFSMFIMVVIVIAASGALLIGHDFLRRVDVLIPEYNPLVLFSSMGMMLLASSNDLMLLFISLEVMSIALYVLTGTNRGEPKAAEAAFKYFIIGAFASAILLMGVALVYGSVGSTDLRAVAQWFAIDGNSLSSNTMLSVGLAMLLVGFGFKVAAAPFHMWSPDVYQGASAPVTAFMATGVKAAGFAALGRVLFVAFLQSKVDWTTSLWIIAALTIMVGNIGALVQLDFKRMLAYSSIAHAGYLLMAVVAAPAGGLVNNPRMGGILFYLLAYTFMNIGAFSVVTLFTRDGVEETQLSRLSGLADRHPLVAAGLSICLLSLAGIPPTMGFVGKFYLFAATVEGGFPGLAVVGAIGGAIGVFYYLRPIVIMYMQPAEKDAVVPQINNAAMGALAVAVAGVLLLGLMPGPVVDWARESLLSLATWGGA